MLGSFGPRQEIYIYDTPPEEAPSGLNSLYKIRKNKVKNKFSIIFLKIAYKLISYC
jgi:hypothetical protein